MRVKLIVYCMGTLLMAGAHAETYYVATNGMDSRTGIGGWTNALATISNALDKAAADGDLVLVAPGRYVLAAELMLTNHVAVVGLNGPEQTEIDGNYPARTNRSARLTHVNAVLAGFTISNSAAFNGAASTNSDGGAVALLNGGMLSNCVIRYSSAHRYGGGVYVANGGVVVKCAILECNAISRGGGMAFDPAGGLLADSTVISNRAGTGGGIHVSSATISNCVIAHNQTTNLNVSSGGGGLHVVGAATIADCEIRENIAQTTGGGGYVNAADSVWERCLIQSNRTESDSVGYGGGGLHLHFTTSVRNCLIVSNFSAINASGFGGGGVYIYRNGTEMRNCSIIANTSSGSSSDGGGLHINRQSTSLYTNTFVNMLVYFNVSGNSFSNYYCGNYTTNCVSFENCCLAPEPLAGYHANTVTDDPRLADVAAGDFQLRRESPCVNAGLTEEWMRTSFDVAGHNRLDVFFRQADIGAYEFVWHGTLFGIR